MGGWIENTKKLAGILTPLESAKKGKIYSAVETLKEALINTLAENLDATQTLEEKKSLIKGAYERNPNNPYTLSQFTSKKIDPESIQASLNLLQQLNNALATWEQDTKINIKTGNTQGVQDKLDQTLLANSKGAIQANSKLIKNELSPFQKAINDFTQAVFGFEAYKSKKDNAFNQEPVLSKLRAFDPSPTIKPK